MTEPTIFCPSCRSEIKLTESLAAPLVESTRRDFEARLAEKDRQLTAQLERERKQISDEEQKKARSLVATDLELRIKQQQELELVLKDREVKLAEAQKVQLEYLRKERELDDARRELDLTVEKKVQETIGSVREQTSKEVEERIRLQVAEKEQTILAMQKTIEELKRKSEQGSQQLQGEVLELEIETTLRTSFPMDSIAPVAKGEFGGDLIQRVIGPTGIDCGAILWECKRTKNWSDSWLSKLREDQRRARAESAVLVSQVLPKQIETFGLQEGIWIVHPKVVVPVAIALRNALIEISTVRQASEGQQTKQELMYQYLNGPRFRQRIEAIADAFRSMREDLDKEKKVIMRQWAKRDQEIERMMIATVGMWGDMQGILGRSLQEIDGLGLQGLEESSELSPVIESEQ